MKLHGPNFQTGDQVSMKTAAEWLAGSQVRVSGSGIPTSSLTQGQIIHRDPPVEFQALDRHLTRSMFLAQIRFMGGGDEEDFADSRYWVREIYEATDAGVALEERATFLMDVNEGVDVEHPNPIRWVPAYNLAELIPDDPDSETHALGLSEDTDDGVIVQVSHDLSVDGTPRYFFNRPSGSAVRPCIIASGPVAPDAKTLVIRWVRSRMSGENFIDEAFGGTEEVLMWWGQRGRHFRGFETGGYIGGLRPEHNVLPAYQVDGLWRVMQVFRETTMWPLPLVQASDCQPHGSSA